MVSELAQILQSKPELLKHSLQVYRMASLVLKETNLSSSQKRDILTASMWHDIGKITWPDEFFTKKEYELKPSDWAMMNTHPIQSVRMCERFNIPLTDQAKKIILCHHDRPSECEMDESTLIMISCDVYVACTENRAYRDKPYTKRQALQQVEMLAPKKMLDVILKYAKHM